VALCLRHLAHSNNIRQPGFFDNHQCGHQFSGTCGHQSQLRFLRRAPFLAASITTAALTVFPAYTTVKNENEKMKNGKIVKVLRRNFVVFKF
jgi:hypothetical protein